MDKHELTTEVRLHILLHPQMAQLVLGLIIARQESVPKVLN